MEEKQKRSRFWYAIECPPEEVSDKVHKFELKAHRDAFVAGRASAGTPCEVVAATHAVVKRALRYAEHGVPWPVPILRNGAETASPVPAHQDMPVSSTPHIST